MPWHINPTDDQRIATAPYNFVPLPNRVYTVADSNVNHDRFLPDTHSGWIDLKIKTLTPLFIRGPVTRKNEGWDPRDSRLRPEPFTTPDGRPVIPGSSLRGMIRTLLEILSFSKITPVTDEKPFFRTVADDRIGKAYCNRMVRGGQKPRGGYIKEEGDQWVIIPAREVLRVNQDLLAKLLGLNFPDKPQPNFYPDWTGQHKPCWFKRDLSNASKVVRISLDSHPGWEEGTLVLTGSAPKKKSEFVFAGKDQSKKIVIITRLWERFHDEDQITQWQKKAFPKNQPSNCRKVDGYLRDGEPVFFLTDSNAQDEQNPDGLVFFGRAQMFRLPYDLSPLDLIPDEIQNAGLDLAEALFGMVGQGKKQERQAIKGRVFFEDAVASGGQDWFEEILVPRILSSPKVTSFQHYLTQDGTRGRKGLTTYLEGDYTAIRGHKLYWHQWDETVGLGAVKEPNDHDQLLGDLQSDNPRDTQHTIIRPVKGGATFNSRLRFENLTDIELGALLSALRLPEGCVHRLGMGKPLGLGSVQIESTLHLVNPANRYACWEDDGLSENDGRDFSKAFEEAMLAHSRNSQETFIDGNEGLRKIARLEVLFELLRWTERPPSAHTDYLPLDKFCSRPVLPMPHYVTGKKEPGWQVDQPRPGNAGAGRENQSSERGAAVGVALKPPPAGRSLPKIKDKVEVVLLEERTKKGGWKAKHERSGLSGPIQNSKDVPDGKQAGDKVLLEVAYITAKEIAFKWPTGHRAGS